MLKIEDYLDWEEYKYRKKANLEKGTFLGAIHEYEDDVIKNLRNVFYNSIPVSIVLLTPTIANGRCYHLSHLLPLAFLDDDFRVVEANVDGIKLNPEVIKKHEHDTEEEKALIGNHSFVERIKKDGSVWVYDTSDGLVYEKSLYYEQERPVITRVYEKEEILADPDVLACQYTSFQETEQGFREAFYYIMRSLDDPRNDFYKDRLKEEISEALKAYDQEHSRTRTYAPNEISQK